MIPITLLRRMSSSELFCSKYGCFKFDVDVSNKLVTSNPKVELSNLTYIMKIKIIRYLNAKCLLN